MITEMTWRDIARFWNKVDVGGDLTCWRWIAGADKDGYGFFSLNSKTVRSHQVAFYLGHGYWPTMHVLHSCDFPRCCNPVHLSDGTTAENTRDRDVRGRTAKGALVGTAKLTEEQVRAIRQSTGSQRAVAKEFGVCQATIWQIRAGHYWKHVL